MNVVRACLLEEGVTRSHEAVHGLSDMLTCINELFLQKKAENITCENGIGLWNICKI